MRKVARPLWVEGCALDPIHLQHGAAYQEQILQSRFTSTLPYAWGVLAFELDAEPLRRGVVSIRRFDAVMGDGTLVQAGGEGGDLLAERALESRTSAERVEVFVALPHLREGQPNVDRMVTFDEPSTPDEGAAEWTVRMLPPRPDADGAPAVRFASRIVELGDEASGQETLRVPCTHYALRISFGGESRERTDAVKLTELVRGASGALVVNEAFVPPLLRIGASPFVMGGLQRVLSAMIAKQQGLAVSRRQRSAARIETQGVDIDRFLILQALNQKLPTMAEVVSTPETHPAAAYRELAELVGLLCTFDIEANPMEVPRYDHLAPGPVFLRLFDLALKMLDRLLAERFVEIPLTLQHDFLLGHLRDPALFQHRFFVAASGPYTASQVREHVPRMMKVSSVNGIARLINSAVHGAKLVPDDYPPAALPLKKGVLFFRLEPSPEEWNEIVATGSIAIHFPFEGFEIAVYAVDPRTL